MRKILFLLAALAASAALHAESVDLHWIDKAPAYNLGQSWGVPFAKGTMNEQGSFTLTDAAGNVVPTQHWVLSRWNDGSVKWMGFYATLGPGQAGNLKLEAVKADKKTLRALARQKPVAGPTLVLRDNDDRIDIDNGLYEISFAKSGDELINYIKMDGYEVVSSGRLVARTEDRSRLADGVVSYHEFETNVLSAEVERSGPVAVVVKITGNHKAVKAAASGSPSPSGSMSTRMPRPSRWSTPSSMTASSAKTSSRAWASRSTCLSARSRRTATSPSPAMTAASGTSPWSSSAAAAT